MSAPAAQPFWSNTPGRRERANWLGRLLEVDKDLEAELRTALKDASKSIDDRFAIAAARSGRYPKLQQAQLALAHNEIRGEIIDLFDNVEDIIEFRKQDAAVAAVSASLHDQSHFLTRIFEFESDKNFYIESLRASARRNIETVETRVLESKIPLSEQVWDTAALAAGWVDRVIHEGMATGKSAIEIAKDVRPLINPDTPGGVSYAAFRLARTEINNAFHAQSIWDAQNDPWIEFMKWNLSAVHRIPDECTLMAGNLYRKDEVPVLPHPQCRCYVVPELPSEDVFFNNLRMGTYDDYIDEMMYGGGRAHAAETAPKPRKKRRKTRSDKGKKRGAYGPRKTPTTTAKKAPVRKKRRKTRSDKGVKRGPRKTVGVPPQKTTSGRRTSLAPKPKAPVDFSHRKSTVASMATTPEEAIAALRAKWDGMGLPLPIAKGWTTQNFPRLQDAIDAVQGIDEVLTKFPALRERLVCLNAESLLGFGDPLGMTSWLSPTERPEHYKLSRNPGHSFGPGGMDSMFRLNTSHTRKPKYIKGRRDEMERQVIVGRIDDSKPATSDNQIRKGYKAIGSNHRGWHYTSVHELGHVMDGMMGDVSSNMAQHWAMDLYQQEKAAGNTKLSWNKWAYQNAPSTYSFPLNSDGSPKTLYNWRGNDVYFNGQEFVAEAFADVWTNGDKAQRLSKMIYEKMIDQYTSRFGTEALGY